MLCVFIFLGGIAALFYIPKFRVVEISIEGLNNLEREDFKKEISGVLSGKFYGILPYDNILIVPREKIALSLLLEFPLLKSVSVRREFPQFLSVTVEERKVEALWCPGIFSTSTSSIGEGLALSEVEGCAFTDASGFIFQPAPFFLGTVFLKFFDERIDLPAVGKEMLTGSEFRKLLVFKDKLNGKNLGVSRIILKDGGIYEIHLIEGWHILINDKNEAEQSFDNLELVLEATIKEKRPKLDYVDLRFGKKVFFKLGNSK